MTPALNRVAISQTVINYDQVDLSDVFSGQSLNVVDVSYSVSAPNTATGNGLIASVSGGGLNIKNSQTLGGNVTAQTTLNVVVNAGVQTGFTATALGNLSELGSPDGGPVSGVVTQIAGPVQVLATASFAGATAQAGATALNVQAMANAYQLNVADTSGSSTSANTAVTQTSSANTEADGGAVLNSTPGTAGAGANAASNDITGTGAGVAGQTLTATQTMTGSLTQATQHINLGDGQTIQSFATATANNLSLTGENGAVSLVDSQSNIGLTFAQSAATGFQFGTGQAVSTAIANSVVAGATGQQLSLDNTQSNTGGIVSNASFNGTSGFDAFSAASATGNAVNGYACSDCGGVSTIRGSQTNSGGVQANSTIDIVGSNRNINASANATGNSATFYVSKH